MLQLALPDPCPQDINTDHSSRPVRGVDQSNYACHTYQLLVASGMRQYDSMKYPTQQYLA